MKPTTTETINALADTIRDRSDAWIKIEVRNGSIDVEFSAGVRGFIHSAELDDGEQTPGDAVRSMLSRLLAEVSVTNLDTIAEPAATVDGPDFIQWEPGALLGRL